MISQTTVVRNSPQQDLLNELKIFINGTKKKQDRTNSIELTKTALLLLRKLPTCRGAVFEYFCKVFDSASYNYIQAIETEINTGKLPDPPESDELTISEIHMALISLISENSVAWAPTISTWSLELLGEISTKYSGRAHVSANLNETLQLWMACRATRTLVDVNTKCLSSLIHSDTEACISALLDTSVKHSPNFDWVVAHVGSCFPNTVITRVISVGLKDFSQNRSYDQVRNSPKLKSVVGILGHLAGSHARDIKQAIVEMFMWSLRETFDDTDASRLQKKATVPYILQLVYLSATLLSSICNEIKNILTVDVIGKLCYFIDDWIKYFGTPEALEEHITHLILKCQTGGVQILNLILSCAQISKLKGCNETVKNDIREKSMELLENILQDMEESVRHGNPVEILSSCSKDIQEINNMLLSSNKIVSSVACRLTLYLGHINPSSLVKSITFLLEYATTAEQLALVLKILTSELIDKASPSYAVKGGHFSVVLEQIFSRNIQKYSHSNEETLDLSQMWTNLLTLLEWEKHGELPLLRSNIVTRALKENFINLTSVFSSEVHHMHIIADILDKTEIPSVSFSYSPPIRVILNLTQSAVNYFFACCRDEVEKWPQSDGIVERHNRAINQYLSIFVDETQVYWDKLVPLFLLAYRSSQPESTGYTPSMLLTGREMKLPVDLMFGRPSVEEEENERSLPEYVADLKERLRVAHEFAREKLQLRSDKMKMRLGSRQLSNSFNEGDAVWLYQPQRSTGLSPKLQRPWEGPYRIVKKINNLVYRIQLSPRAKAKLSSEVHHMHIIADILDKTEIPSVSFSYSPPIRVILNLTQSAVNYFFACCRDEGTTSKLRGFKKACRILKRLCIYSKVAKVLALRELLERALFRSDNVLFGAKNSVVHDNSEKSLLKQNKKINKTIPLTKHSTVLNGGIIGLGKRKAVTEETVPAGVVASNTAELICVLKACCSLPEEGKYSEISLDSMTLLSLLLVQFVSPDVMYNGLPWPEEEFSKVTIERDLFIRRIFTNTPLLWDLLSFVAVYRPAICYCSVLIRALTATLIHQWKSMGDQSKETGNENYTILLDTTIKVLDIMSLGQLLPPPLCNIRDVLPSLRCFEIVDILRECIWCYMRDHIPSPALFSCDSNGIHWRDPITARPLERYTNTLRIIMQRNIETLGHMYSQMFINIPRHE